MANKELKKLEADSSITLLMVEGIDIGSRTIYLWDRSDTGEADSNGLDSSVSSKVIKGIRLLSRESNELITIVMHSFGGSVEDAYAIYDTMRSCKCRFRVEAMGACMSAATMVLAAGDERIAHKNTAFMIHDGSPEFLGHSTRDSEAWVAYNKRERFNYYKILAEASNMPAKHWEKLCATDKLMVPTEALAYGLITKIIPHRPRPHKPTR